MVVHERRRQLSEDDVDRIFRALADRTRRDIVRRTLVGEVTVSQLASSYDMSFAAVQKHVAVLEGAGLITKHPNGRERLVRGNPETIRRAQVLLDQFEDLWRERVARLDALFADGPPEPGSDTDPEPQPGLGSPPSPGQQPHPETHPETESHPTRRT